MSMKNKDFYNIFQSNAFIKPYLHKFWENTFSCYDEIHWHSVYESLYNSCITNNVKQFKFKLLHNIIATNENLYKWKITQTPDCQICACKQDYSHFFISCKAIDTFWGSISNTFQKCGFNKNMRQLKFIVIGYKTQEYCQVNTILNLVSFSIYKSYYASDKRSKQINILCLFKNELSTAIFILKQRKKDCRFLENFLKNC